MCPLEPAEVPAALRGRRVAVLVSGGVAAYKVADLVSRLAQAGCEVRVAMTAAARRFVGAETFHALSGRPVRTDVWAGEVPEPHVELGDWAQLVLVAPATANTLARLAHGQADDLVTPSHWVGLDNYAALAQDPHFAQAVGNTVLYTVLYVPLSILFGFLVFLPFAPALAVISRVLWIHFDRAVDPE